MALENNHDELDDIPETVEVLICARDQSVIDLANERINSNFITVDMQDESFEDLSKENKAVFKRFEKKYAVEAAFDTGGRLQLRGSRESVYEARHHIKCSVIQYEKQMITSKYVQWGGFNDPLPIRLNYQLEHEYQKWYKKKSELTFKLPNTANLYVN